MYQIQVLTSFFFDSKFSLIPLFLPSWAWIDEAGVLTQHGACGQADAQLGAKGYAWHWHAVRDFYCGRREASAA